EWRVNADVRNADIAAGIDIDAVTIGIDFDVIDCEIVDAGGQDGEVTSMQNRNIADQDIGGELETDRFGSAAIRYGVRAHKSLAPDQAGTNDRNVNESFAPDQAVVKMAVSEILIFVPWVRFRRIVRSVIGRRIGGNDSCSLIEIERDVAFQTDRKTQIRSGRKTDGSATGSCTLIHGLVNRG